MGDQRGGRDRTSCGGPDAVGRRLRVTVALVHFGNKALDVLDDTTAGAGVEQASGLRRRYRAWSPRTTAWLVQT